MRDKRKPNSSLTPAGRPRSSALAGFSVRYPVTICAVFSLLLLVGVVSLFKIPLVLFPDLDLPFVMVQIPYPNATPAHVLQTITKPVEEAVSTVPGIQWMQSFSTSGRSGVQTFFDFEMDVQRLRGEVRERVERVRSELPEDVERIYVVNFSTDDTPILGLRIASERNLQTAYEFLDLKIKRRIERVPGVAEVELFGTQRPEIGVYLSLDELRRYRVDAGRLFRNLSDINLDRSLGQFTDGGVRYGAMTRGMFRSMEDFKLFPVNERGLLLEDVANVVYESPTAHASQHLNGEYAVGLWVRKAAEANTVTTVRDVEAELETIRSDPALQGIQLDVIRNAGAEIVKALKGLLTAGTVGALLALGVLVLFLRKWSAALVVALAIPLSLVGSLGFLYFGGLSLNVLSMMGLMLATGMLVDNAIVVLESIYRNLEQGADRLQAVKQGTQEVQMAVIAATLTSIIIFVPLVFGAESFLSFWLRHCGLAIIFALLCSLFLSLTLIPLAMGRFLKLDLARATGAAPIPAGGEGDAPAVGDGRKPGRRRIMDFYLKLVAWPLRHRFLVGFLMVPLAVAGSTWLLLNVVPDNAPDAQEPGSLRISYEFTENYHYAKIERDYVDPVESFLTENKEAFKIDQVFSSFSNNSASTEIYLHDGEVSLEEMEEIRLKISDGLPVIPGCRIELSGQSGRQNREGISVSLYGDDPRVLDRLLREARAGLGQYPDFSRVSAPRDSTREEVQIRLRRDLARRYGVSTQSVSQILGILMRGRQVRGFRTPEGEVDVIVRLRPEDRSGLEDLRSAVVGYGDDGEEILLSQVAELRIEKVAAQVQREDGQTYANFFATYAGDKRDEGIRLMTEVMDGLDYPAGYGWSLGFWTRRNQQSDQEWIFNILLALFMVYFVMASLFESLTHPLAIMLSLPFSVVGIAGFLLITGTPFNIMAKIGLLVLIGIVVNNGIVLIDRLNTLRRRGVDRRRAILQGCRDRFRPIVMTATTTIVGLIPLAYSYSSFFDLRYFPMARTVMGGLIASTVLTLVVLPTYYTLFDDLTNWLRRSWQASDPSSGGEAASWSGVFHAPTGIGVRSGVFQAPTGTGVLPGADLQSDKDRRGA